MRMLLVAVLGWTLAAGPALAEPRILLARSAVIADAKACGWAWDAGWCWIAAPDPYVKCWVYDPKTGKQVDYGETTYQRDTHTPVWSRELARVEPGDLIKIEVWDKDLKYDDLIGRYEFVLTAEMIGSGQVTLCFGQVAEIRFDLRSIRD